LSKFLESDTVAALAHWRTMWAKCSLTRLQRAFDKLSPNLNLNDPRSTAYAWRTNGASRYVTGGWLDEVPSIAQTALMDTRAQRSFYGPKIVRCCWPAWKQLATGVAARSHTTSWRICCCAHL